MANKYDENYVKTSEAAYEKQKEINQPAGDSRKKAWFFYRFFMLDNIILTEHVFYTYQNRGWNQKVVHNVPSGKLHQAGACFVTLEEN